MIAVTLITVHHSPIPFFLKILGFKDILTLTQAQSYIEHSSFLIWVVSCNYMYSVVNSSCCLYMSAIEEVMLKSSGKYRPGLVWICGHIHDGLDPRGEETLLACTTLSPDNTTTHYVSHITHHHNDATI